MLKRMIVAAACGAVLTVPMPAAAQEAEDPQPRGGPAVRRGHPQQTLIISAGDENRIPIKTQFEMLAEEYGIEIRFDPKLRDDSVADCVEGRRLGEALEALAQGAGVFYKVRDDDTIIVVEDTPQNRREYDELAIKAFALENVEPRVADRILRSLIEARRLSTVEEPPAVILRDTVDKVEIAGRLIDLVDRPRAEVEVRVEVLEFAASDFDEVTATDVKGARTPVRWDRRRFEKAVAKSRGTELAQTHLSIVEGGEAHYADHRTIGVRFDLELAADAHPAKGEVTLAVKLRVANAEGGESQDLHTSMRIAGGETYLLTGFARTAAQDEASESDRRLVVALTPTIVRAPAYTEQELEAIIVGTESRITFGEPLAGFVERHGRE